MKKIRRSPLSISLMMVALYSGLLTACDSGSDPVSTNSSPTEDGGLKLGALLPITGDLSSIGQNMPDAVNLAVEEINACGGINEKPVTLVTEDTQTDPTAGSAAMTKLAEVDKVAGVVGAFASSVSSSAVDIAVRNRVMMVSPGSTSPVFTERAQNGEFEGFWARTAPPDTYQAKALAALAKKKGFTTASTAAINNDYGVGFEQRFISAFEKLGWHGCE